MEGTYRLSGGETGLFESFVAAPGPAGWRYFGRIFAGDSELELSTVDFVVDTEWRLIRYRERRAPGPEIVIVPTLEGVEVSVRDESEDRSIGVAGVEVVWSRSPCSLLVAERRLRALRTYALRAVKIEPTGEASSVEISLARLGGVKLGGDDRDTARNVLVRENGRTIEALMGEDRPLSAEGWFELLPSG